MSHSSPAVTLSVRILPEVRDQLEKLSDATGRTKSFLAAEAIESYLATQVWQIQTIEKAVKKAVSKKARFFDHNNVVDWVENWGRKNEKEMPK